MARVFACMSCVMAPPREDAAGPRHHLLLVAARQNVEDLLQFVA
jgi:hypothetical protein